MALRLHGVDDLHERLTDQCLVAYLESRLSQFANGFLQTFVGLTPDLPLQYVRVAVERLVARRFRCSVEGLQKVRQDVRQHETRTEALCRPSCLPDGRLCRWRKI